jgi:hypothetical protein
MTPVSASRLGCALCAGSVVRGQFVAQAAKRRAAAVLLLLLDLAQLAQQQVDLLLLARNDLVEVFHQVFGEAELDLQIRQALVDAAWAVVVKVALIKAVVTVISATSQGRGRG